MSTEERSQLEEARAELEALRSKVEGVRAVLTSLEFWKDRTGNFRTVDPVEVADFVLERLREKTDWSAD